MIPFSDQLNEGSEKGWISVIWDLKVMQLQGKFGLEYLSVSVVKSLEWYELPFSFIVFCSAKCSRPVLTCLVSLLPKLTIASAIA